MNKFTLTITDSDNGVEFEGVISQPADATSPAHQFAAGLAKHPEMLTPFMQSVINKLGETPVESEGGEA